MENRIYLDNAATTCMDPRVLEAMLPYFTIKYGNPSSLHFSGTQAKQDLDRCKEMIAGTLGAKPDEIIFTSGGTESNNLALKGIAFANRNKGNHIIVSAIEHDCILNTCKWLETQGFYITYLPVDHYGYVDVQILRNLINPKTILVSVMYANNEIGTVQPIKEIGKICREYSVPFHSDACQSYGKMPINTETDYIDLLTVNSHKIYGPKGVGALFIRNGIKITPLLHGGGQEHGLRSSTENLPGIIGFATAAGLCMDEMQNELTRLTGLRQKFIQFLSSNFNNAYINGHPENRIPGHINFSFQGLEGETIRLLLLLDEKGISVSAGSACSSNDKSHSASHVLQAIGLNSFEARGSIRISMGRFTTEKDINLLNSALKDTVFQLKSIFSY